MHGYVKVVRIIGGILIALLQARNDTATQNRFFRFQNLPQLAYYKDTFMNVNQKIGKVKLLVVS